MREFKEGFLYVLEEAPYEMGGFEIECDILTEHTLLCFGTGQEYQAFFLSESDNANHIKVKEGKVKPITGLEVGDWKSDDTAKFVVCEVNDQMGEADYVTVAVLY